MSIGNIIENFLTALSSNVVQNSDDYFNKIIDLLFEKMSQKDTDENTTKIICELLTNSILYNNLNIKFGSMIEKSLMTKLEKIYKIYNDIIIENQKKILDILTFITKINNNLLENFETKSTPNFNYDKEKNEIIKLIKITDKIDYQFTTFNNNSNESTYVFSSYKNNFKNYCESLNNMAITTINDIISNNNFLLNNNKKVVNSFSPNNTETLGIKTIQKFEFLQSVFDLYINCLEFNVDERVFITAKIQDILKTNIFSVMCDLYFNYPSNNIYQNIFLQFIQIITNKNSPKELINGILLINDENTIWGNNNLISLIVNEIIKNYQYTFEVTNHKMNNLLFGSNVLILQKIFESDNSYIEEEIIPKLSNEKIFYEKFITKITEKFSKKLYKNETNEEKETKLDPYNPRFDALKEQTDANINFSLEPLKEIIEFNLSVYEKCINNENYENILKEHEAELEVRFFYIIIFILIQKRKAEKENLNYSISSIKSENGDENDIDINQNSQALVVADETENENKEKYNDNNYWNVKPSGDDSILDELK